MIRPVQCLIVLGTLFSTTPSFTAEPVEELVDELRVITDKARQQRAADRWLLHDLEELVARYDNPWRREILFEDFSDGDYERNPNWQVISGNFWVVRDRGLRSQQRPDTRQPERPPSEGKIGRAIIGALLEQALKEDGSEPAAARPQTSAASEIMLRQAISNAFAITSEFALETPYEPGRFALLLLQGDSGRYGYRLKLSSGRDGHVELERIRDGFISVVERRPLPLDIGGGGTHTLDWRQAPDGKVTVMLDGQGLFSIHDKAFRDGYQQLHLVHWSGDLTLRSLQIAGTP